MRLTNKIVDALEYEGKQYGSGGWSRHFVQDDVPGFAVRVYPSGAKTFVFTYRNQYGKQRDYKIGNFPEISASAAREEAERLRGVVRNGADPNATVAELRQMNTIKEMCEQWLGLHARQSRASWETDQKRLERHVYPRWGTRAVPEVSTADVLKMRNEIADGKGLKRGGGPVEANRTVQLVRTIFAWAISTDSLPVGTKNPARARTKGRHGDSMLFAEKPRERLVLPEELPWLLDGIDAIGNPFVREALWFMLHTGCRKREALDLEWTDVDFDRAEVTFRETKNGEDHTIPMAKPLVKRLRALDTIENNPYVFPGNREGRPLKNIRKTWRKALRTAGELASKTEPQSVAIDMSDVTIHDLRRTVASMLLGAGANELLIGRVLNHKPQSVTSIYARVLPEDVRAALERHAVRLEDVRRPERGNIVPLARGGRKS